MVVRWPLYRPSSRDIVRLASCCDSIGILAIIRAGLTRQQEGAFARPVVSALGLDPDLGQVYHGSLAGFNRLPGFGQKLRLLRHEFPGLFPEELRIDITDLLDLAR